MNSKAALLLMLCAIVIASFLHGRKLSAKDNDMDRLAKGLEGIETHIKADTRILVENRTSNGALSLRSRYWLAPTIIDMSGVHDTILMITEQNIPTPTDSTRKQLWSNADSLYHYTLSCTH